MSAEFALGPVAQERPRDIPAPDSPSKISARKSVAPVGFSSAVGRTRRINSDDAVLNIASVIFINLRVNPNCLIALWSLEDKPSVDLCKSIISDYIFPDDGSIETELQLSRLLGKFVFLEVVKCKDLETLFRDNSLTALLTSSYCKRKSAQTFLMEHLNPILIDTVLDAKVHGGDSDRIKLMQLLLQRIVSVICAKVHTLPVGLAFIAENIFAGLKAYQAADSASQVARERMAACSVGSIVFLRFIVPHIAMYDQGNSNNLPSAEHESIKKFFLDAASCLMKMSNGTSFPSSHKLSNLNDTVQDLSGSVQSAFFRMSVEVALERIDASDGKRALSSSIQVIDLLKFMKSLVSVKHVMIAEIDASDDDTKPHQAILSAIEDFASLSEQAILSSNCVRAKGPVDIPLSDLSHMGSAFDKLSPSSTSNICLKEENFTDEQMRIIEEAGMIVQDTISGRSFHSNRLLNMSKSRFRYISPIAIRMTRSIVFQRFILVLCLLHCFMAVYETRPFRDHKTREQCLKASPDSVAMTNIFASESVILLFYWAFFFAKVFTRSGQIGGWSLLQVCSFSFITRIVHWRGPLSFSLLFSAVVRDCCLDCRSFVQLDEFLHQRRCPPEVWHSAPPRHTNRPHYSNRSFASATFARVIFHHHERKVCAPTVTVPWPSFSA